MKTTYAIFTSFQLYLAIQVYSMDAGFFDDVWTKNDIKFLLVQLVVLIVSMRYLYKEESEKKPTIPTTISVIVLNAFAVALGYEFSIQSQTKVWLAMLICFMMGLLANTIIEGVLKSAPVILEKILNILPDVIGEKIKKML